MSPHHGVGTERYLLIFTVPVIFALGLALDRLRFPQAGVVAGALGLCAVLLASFYGLYFRAMETTPTFSNAPYATGPQDPKLAALQWIRDDMHSRNVSRREPPQIITDGWWTYWPLRYFGSYGEMGARVYHIPSNDAPMPQKDLLGNLQAFEKVSQRGAYALGFSDGTFSRVNQASNGLKICAQQDFQSYAKRPVITVWRYCDSG